MKVSPVRPTVLAAIALFLGLSVLRCSSFLVPSASLSMPPVGAYHGPSSRFSGSPSISLEGGRCSSRRAVGKASSSSLRMGVTAPADMYQTAVNAGEKKGNMPASKIFSLGILSGCHIAFGGLLMLLVGGNCAGIASANPGLKQLIAGAFGLPFGLYMTVVGGGELFTGNTAMVTAARIEGKVTNKQLLKNWIVSYLGNFLGSLLMVALVVGAKVLPTTAGVVGIASAKSSLTFSAAFLRGILCNWLVCMAVYMSAGCDDAASKFVSIFLPISAFVAIGFDHSVANMFLIPLGIKVGAGVTIRSFLVNNLIPVTLGNIVGGAVAVAGMYSTAFGSLFKK